MFYRLKCQFLKKFCSHKKQPFIKKIYSTFISTINTNSNSYSSRIMFILVIVWFVIICFINGWKYKKVATNWDRVTNWCVYLTHILADAASRDLSQKAVVSHADYVSPPSALMDRLCINSQLPVRLNKVWESYERYTPLFGVSVYIVSSALSFGHISFSSIQVTLALKTDA